MNQQQKHLPPILRYFIVSCGIWTAMCLGTEAICRFVLHWGYPYNYPAVPPSLVFGDFRSWTAKFAFFHTRDFFHAVTPLMYPAPVVVAYKLFLIPQPRHALVPTLVFLATILVASGIMLAGFRRGLIRRGLAPRVATLFLLATWLLSFPFWFEIHQANMEFAVWVLLTTGIWAIWTGRNSVAMVCFGIAGAMKIFPLVFLGLFIARRQYRLVAGALAVFAVTTVVSLWLVCPDIAYSYRETAAGLALFREMYMLHLRPMESGFDHSLFALIKRLLPSIPPPAAMSHLLDLYLATVAVLGCVLFFTRIRKLPLINQVLCLTLAAVFLPPTSFDYTLIHLYPPFALLVFFTLERAAEGIPGVPSRGVIFCFLLLAFALSAQSEFIVHGVRIAGHLKAVALLLLWAVAIKYPFAFASEQESTADRIARAA